MKLQIRNYKLEITKPKTIFILLISYFLFLTSCYAQSSTPRLTDWHGTSKNSWQIGVNGAQIKFNNDSLNYYIKYNNGGVWDSTQFVGTKNPRGNHVWQNIFGYKWYKTKVRIDTLDVAQFFKLGDSLGTAEGSLAYKQAADLPVFRNIGGDEDSIVTVEWMKLKGKTKWLAGGGVYSLPYQKKADSTLFFTPSLADTNKFWQYYSGGWRLANVSAAAIDSTIWAKRSWVTANFVSTETDPIFSASPANITGYVTNDLGVNIGGYLQINSTYWGDKAWVASLNYKDSTWIVGRGYAKGTFYPIDDGKFVSYNNSTGMIESSGYNASSFIATETDPVFSASPANITGYVSNDLGVNIGGYLQINSTYWGDKAWVASLNYKDSTWIVGRGYAKGTFYPIDDGKFISYNNSTGMIESSGYNASSFLTTETDPTIYAWAKAATKPSYTYSEVGAQVAGNYQAQLNGTGFVKASGTTISYDNSTYLTTETDPNVSAAIKGITTIGTGLEVATNTLQIDFTPLVLGSTGTTAAAGNHNHSGVYQPAFTGKTGAYTIEDANLDTWVFTFANGVLTSITKNGTEQ